MLAKTSHAASRSCKLYLHLLQTYVLQYGLPPALENLNNEGREILEEAYKADPAWLTKVLHNQADMRSQ